MSYQYLCMVNISLCISKFRSQYTAQLNAYATQVLNLRLYELE